MPDFLEDEDFENETESQDSEIFNKEENKDFTDESEDDYVNISEIKEFKKIKKSK